MVELPKEIRLRAAATEMELMRDEMTGGYFHRGGTEDWDAIIETEKKKEQEICLKFGLTLEEIDVEIERQWSLKDKISETDKILAGSSPI